MVSTKADRRPITFKTPYIAQVPGRGKIVSMDPIPEAPSARRVSFVVQQLKAHPFRNEFRDGLFPGEYTTSNPEIINILMRVGGALRVPFDEIIEQGYFTYEQIFGKQKVLPKDREIMPDFYTMAKDNLILFANKHGLLVDTLKRQEELAKEVDAYMRVKLDEAEKAELQEQAKASKKK